MPIKVKLYDYQFIWLIGLIRSGNQILSFRKTGREPTEDELAEEMKIPVSKISHLPTVSKKPASLETPIGEEENNNLGDIIPDEKGNFNFRYSSNEISRVILIMLYQHLTQKPLSDYDSDWKEEIL